MGPLWYLRRLSRMGPREVSSRVLVAVRVRRWRRAFADPAPAGPAPSGARFTAALPAGALAAVPPAARERLLATAADLMDGRAEYFGVLRTDMVAPDWSADPRTGRRAPTEVYAFDVPHRDEAAVGDIKQIWEPSRHQHLTVLAAAYALTGDERYAHRVADHLKSWWAANPPLRGAHWTSGIELGIRLLAWVWTRRLLDGWPGAPDLFERNGEAAHQVLHHQRWLAAFPSRGSSANNHAVAESAGMLAAACAFDWFAESAGWRAAALRSLEDDLVANTFPSGLNRELATEYHGLVLELGVAAAAEAVAAGVPVPAGVWRTLTRMGDALAAVVDRSGRPPRQGDSDDGRGLVLDGAATDRWSALLSVTAGIVGGADWWPSTAPGEVLSPLLVALAGRHPQPDARPARRPAHFADAGLTILRADDGDAEIWCRCDGGPHGFLSIAAHAHADALSVEVRHDGVDVLADPGCYCYHGEPEWRSYVRSTRGHNTLELDGEDQSRSGGPFLWTRHARSRVLVAHTAEEGVPEGGTVSRWLAEHDGYSRPRRRTVHRRAVELDAGTAALVLHDSVSTTRTHRARLSFHLGPLVAAELDGRRARLRWSSGGRDRTALLELPGELSWTSHRGEHDPPLGWYSAGFGRREPAVTLVGLGRVGPRTGTLTTTLRFRPVPGGTS